MIGSFGSLTFNDIVGYRITANWTPNVGFQGFFYVYVWDQNQPQTAFPEAVNAGTNGAPTRGTLTLDGNQRTYTFTNIDLMSAQVGATRRFRYRLLEYRFDPAVTQVKGGTTPVQITNNVTDQPAPGGLKTDYNYALDQGSEPLFGYRTRVAATGVNVVRFSSMRNNQNCFLQKMIAANDSLNQGQPLPQFTVQFSQQSYNVTQDNLGTMYVEESYGYLQGEKQPPLADLIPGAVQGITQKAVRLELNDYTQRDLLELDQNTDPTPRELESRTIETATFVFKVGNYQNVQIT